MYAFFRDERAGNARAACAMVTAANQRELIAEEHVSSCPAAFFKIWNTGPGVYSAAREAQISAKAKRTDETEVAKAKILVVGDQATVIDPGREETEEYVYRDGQWLFVKQEENNEAAALAREAEAREAKNEAAIRAGEAQGTASELRASGEEP